MGQVRKILVRALLATWLPCAAHAVTVTLPAVADNTLIENATGIFSNGGGDAIYVGVIPRQGNGKRRGLVRFDLVSIPAGSQVTAATLTLTLVRTQIETSQVAAHKVTESWGEGTSVCPIPCGRGTISTANDATWLHRFYPGTNWSVAGGVFVPAASAVASVTPTTGVAFHWSGAQIAADVQSWIDNPASNAGWILLDEASSSSKAYGSREGAAAPQLTVTYTAATPPPEAGDVPLPAWALVVLAAGLLGATVRLRRG